MDKIVAAEDIDRRMVALDQGLSAKLPELLLQRFGNGFVRTWRTAAKQAHRSWRRQLKR